MFAEVINVPHRMKNKIQTYVFKPLSLNIFKYILLVTISLYTPCYSHSLCLNLMQSNWRFYFLPSTIHYTFIYTFQVNFSSLKLFLLFVETCDADKWMLKGTHWRNLYARSSEMWFTCFSSFGEATRQRNLELCDESRVNTAHSNPGGISTSDYWRDDIKSLTYACGL